MKKIIALLLLFIAFAFGADYKPFEFTNITNDSATQQNQFDYMLKYKLFGHDFIKIGNDVSIPDKSGWNGTAGNMTSDARLTLGGPILVTGDFIMGDGKNMITGPVRADSIAMNNVNNSHIGGYVCLERQANGNATTAIDGTIYNFDAPICLNTDSVPTAPVNLEIPTVDWTNLGADTVLSDIDISFNNNLEYTITVPKGENAYKIFVNKIHLCKTDKRSGSSYNGCKLYVKMQDGGRLTEIFVNDLVIGNHSSIQVVYDTDTGTVVQSQNSYRGNLLFYSNEFIDLDNTDFAPIQGTFISSDSIFLGRNINIAGQLITTKLEIGNTLDGKNFRFVKFDPDTIDVKLDKYGGLWENDSIVTIPIELSDTTDINVSFKYCFVLNDSVNVDDFDSSKTAFPICGVDTIEAVIPIGSTKPTVPIEIYVKIDSLLENDTLTISIFDISGAILPNGKTDGDLKVKIIDAEAKQNTSIVLDKTDTIKTYQEELRIPPGTGIVGNIKYTDDGLAPLIWTYEDPSGLFTVEDGVIKTNHVFDYETEDTVYVIKVKVEDGEFADSANYTIKITNIQEPITVSGKIEKVEENADVGTIVGAIIGKDADSTDVTYSINDVVNFKIDPVLGIITTNTVFDFETKDKYPVTVTVTSTDGSKKDTTFIVNIKDVDEPVHAHDTTLTVKEGDKGVIGTIKGEDEDGEPVKFSCDDTVHYSIDSLTGVLRLVDPFDYETTKSDTLKVVVKDVNGNTDTATVIINVENVNEPPVLQPNDSLSVPENCDTCFVGIIVAVDPDTDKVIYEVKEPGFKIDSNGVLTVTKPLDFETTPEVKITIIAKDSSGAADTATYTITVVNVNEPVHVNDTTCSVKENYTGKVCQIPATDEDKTTPKYFLTDTTNYQIDSTGTLVIKNPIDFEKKTKDTVKVVVTDGKFYDTATVVIRVLDELETVKITEWDKNPPPDTVKTNDPDHEYKWKICEGDSCTTHYDNPQIHKDTTIKVCNANKTVCDSIVVIFNDAPPVVTLTNAKSTDALIDYITIEEKKDDKIYVNKKENTLTVTVRDTVHKTEKSFPIDVKLDTVHVSSKNVTEYKYLIDESLATKTPIGGGLFELKEVVEVDGRKVTLTKIVDKNLDPVDTVQTVTYTVKQDGKNLTITYKIDNLSGQRVTDYEVSYQVDSCTTVSYYLNDDKKIAKNKEGNIAYTITYEYTDDFGNKASSKVDIIFDNIPPKVEIFDPEHGQAYNTNAIPVKWTVNGETQDTLTLQRLEKGVNYVIRRYVDKAGNVAADTVMVIMKEAKDIDIELVHPVTKVDQNKVDEYYSDHKYNDKKPFDVKFVDPKNDTIPEVVGVGFKVDIVLPSVSPTGSLATLDDIVKNGQIPVDDKGNIVGASTKGIPVDQYVEEHCTEEFQKDYQKNGLNIPLYDVTYNLHLWVYTNAANYVNDFTVEFTLNDEAKTTSAGTVQMVIDWLADKDGHVKAKNGHGLGTGAYLTKLFSKSVAKHRCDYKEQRKGDRTVKKDETFKTFGYKRPIAK
jgi:hypothetical protein